MVVVYLMQNIDSGKYYIGYTNNLKARWYNHCKDVKYGSKTHFHCAIRKYGPAVFTCEILSSMNTEEEAKNLEKLWIIALRSYDSKIGYNSTFGGDGVIPTPELRKKRSAYWKSREIGGKNLINLVGQRYGRLLVMKKGLSSKKASGGNARWVCICDCGKEKLVGSSDLRSGNSQSCGCLQKERATGRPRRLVA